MFTSVFDTPQDRLRRQHMKRIQLALAEIADGQSGAYERYKQDTEQLFYDLYGFHRPESSVALLKLLDRHHSNLQATQNID